MLDLSGTKAIRVDPDRRLAVAQPGLTLGEFDRATQAFGLATTTGVVSMTGIAGLTLGGGVGWLNGKHGLACDNLLAADVVLADGRSLTVSAGEHEDLYWALRGGSGNFGVVTSFTYRLHDVGPVLAGGVSYPFAWAREFFEAMKPFLDRGVYVNDLGAEDQDRVREAYGANYERLATVKQKYDPANLFRLNHNIQPAHRAASPLS